MMTWLSKIHMCWVQCVRLKVVVDEVQKCFGLIISYSSDNGMSYQDVVD
jgi:hypothetical protein